MAAVGREDTCHEKKNEYELSAEEMDIKLGYHYKCEDEYHSLEQFRNDVKLACKSPTEPVMIVSYSRIAFGQTGDGHWSSLS